MFPHGGIVEFIELMEQIKNFNYDAVRQNEENYFEAVILSKDMEGFSKKIEIFFGVAIWPSLNKLPPKVEIIVTKFGGIMSGQKLYYKQADNPAYAMFWPWQDGQRVTVKIFRERLNS